MENVVRKQTFLRSYYLLLKFDLFWLGFTDNQRKREDQGKCFSEHTSELQKLNSTDVNRFSQDRPATVKLPEQNVAVVVQFWITEDSIAGFC